MTKLPNDFLEKVDRASMAHGIEVRVPFLDANLTAYALSLPASIKIRGMKKKWLLRRALRGILPDAILDGPKTGFNVPFEYWLKEPLADYMKSILTACATKNSHLFDHGEISTCIDEHISGHRDHGPLLYKLLNLCLWYEEYIS
jgi:asparagine synthase (glutamine-hydrolysing)